MRSPLFTQRKELMEGQNCNKLLLFSGGESKCASSVVTMTAKSWNSQLLSYILPD